MPLSLSRAFVEIQSFTSSRINEYADGASQRSALLSIARRSWNLSKHLPPATMDSLRAFWVAQGTAPFYFYNPKETSPAFSYDATGAATVGRYRVRFATAWSQNLGVGMLDVSVELVQVFQRIAGLTSNVAIIIDSGAIVGGNWNLTDGGVTIVDAAAQFFLTSVAPLTGGGIAVFHNLYEVIMGCAVSQDVTTVFNAMSTFRYIGSATYQAVLSAVALGVSHILMFSQGWNTDGTGTLPEVVSALTGSGIKLLIFPVGAGQGSPGLMPVPNISFLNGLVAISGGTVYPDYSNASITQAISDYFSTEVGN